MPSLQYLQKMRTQHGSSLPLAEQLHWILEQKILLFIDLIR